MKITYFQDISEETISDKFIYVKSFIPVSEYKDLLYETVSQLGGLSGCNYFKSIRHPDELFIGFGLGGFWAYYNARKYDQYCILINPVLDPVNHLIDHAKFLDIETPFKAQNYATYMEEIKNFPAPTKKFFSFSFIGRSEKEKQEEIYIPKDELIKTTVKHTHNRFPYGVNLDGVIEKIECIMEEVGCKHVNHTHIIKENLRQELQ